MGCILDWRPSDHLVGWAAVGAAATLSVAALVGMAGGGAPVPVTVALVALSTLPLRWRRSHPAAVLVGTAVLFVAGVPWRAPFAVGPGLVFAAYAAAVFGGRQLRLIGGIVAAGVLTAAFGSLLLTGNPRLLGHLTGLVFGYGVAWALGDRARARRAELAQFAARARRLEAERDEQARRAAEEERTRIARELHDVVTHNVSVIAIQAGAARRTAHGDLDTALGALALIEDKARGTLTELRAVLGLLRAGDGTAPRRPTPELADLGELVRAARANGPVELRVDGEPRPLGALVEVCAYRVVQEALTNVAKHAPGAAAHVRVGYGERRLDIAVADDGPGSPIVASGGHGLIGMRERVGLVHGTLVAGPVPGGGFRVEASLPLVVAGSPVPA